MKFKIDENLPFEVAQLLREAGYDTATVHDQNLVGDLFAILPELKKALNALLKRGPIEERRQDTSIRLNPTNFLRSKRVNPL